MENSSLINVIIIDDEISNIETLEILFSRLFDNVFVLGSFTNPEKALEFLEKTQKPVDAIYTDIRMPKMEGIEFAQKAKSYCERIVYTTAFSEYAIQAIKIGAFDYIMKPISIDELRSSVENIENFRLAKEKSQKIPISLKKGIEFIESSTLLRIVAQGNYTLFEFTDKPASLVTRQLNQFEEQFLAYPYYIKVSRSHIINKQHVQNLTRGKVHKLIMVDGTEINIGSTYKNQVLNSLHYINYD